MDLPAFLAAHTDCLDTSESCLRDVIARLGKWVLRGPLPEADIEAYLDVATTANLLGGDASEAAAYVLEAMLQSPRFLYRLENQRAGRLSPHELAVRLSYIVLGAPPDAALLRAADANQLDTAARIERQVQRLLQDPRAIDRSLQFASDWLHLDRMDNLRPNPDRFPEWEPELADDMRRESLAFFRAVVWEHDLPLGALFNSQFTYLTPRLAAHYGLEPRDRAPGATTSPMSPAGAGSSPRAACSPWAATTPPWSPAGSSCCTTCCAAWSRTHPPCLDVTPVPSVPGKSQRTISEARIKDKSCGGCHSKIEPQAFGLEKFDGLGAHHDFDEHGNRLREDGQVLFPGAAEARPYRDVGELMDLLAGSDRVAETLSWKLTQFAIGRPLGAADVLGHGRDPHRRPQARGHLRRCAHPRSSSANSSAAADP